MNNTLAHIWQVLQSQHLAESGKQIRIISQGLGSFVLVQDKIFEVMSTQLAPSRRPPTSRPLRHFGSKSEESSESQPTRYVKKHIPPDHSFADS